MSVNIQIIIGRLGSDPETRTFPNGGSVCNLTVATSETYKDKNTGERKEIVTWHRVVLRNKLGEVAQQYLKKGSQVFIKGTTRHRKWQDQNGQDRYSTEIVGTTMNMLGNSQSSNGQTNKGHGNGGSGQSSGNSNGAGQANHQEFDDFEDQDIPF